LRRIAAVERQRGDLRRIGDLGQDRIAARIERDDPGQTIGAPAGLLPGETWAQPASPTIAAAASSSRQRRARRQGNGRGTTITSRSFLLPAPRRHQ
jgi:hypothetical protein